MVGLKLESWIWNKVLYFFLQKTKCLYTSPWSWMQIFAQQIREWRCVVQYILPPGGTTSPSIQVSKSISKLSKLHTLLLIIGNVLFQTIIVAVTIYWDQSMTFWERSKHQFLLSSPCMFALGIKHNSFTFRPRSLYQQCGPCDEIFCIWEPR